MANSSLIETLRGNRSGEQALNRDPHQDPVALGRATHRRHRARRDPRGGSRFVGPNLSGAGAAPEVAEG
jgi:hypothetical protein